MKKGIVASDLHLFASRSEGRERFENLSAQLRESDALVLNGDIFDFRWANCRHDESIPRALEWLKGLRREFSHLDIFFIPGNHDCLPGFVDGVRKMDGIDLHAHHLVLGRNLFLHGDAANYQMDEAGFQNFRAAWERDRPRAKVAATLYGMVDAVGITEVTHTLWFGRGLAVRRIAWHLDRVRPGWRDEVDECFFGHTHLPIAGVEQEGVRFTNTGSGIRGARFEPAQFRFP